MREGHSEHNTLSLPNVWENLKSNISKNREEFDLEPVLITVRKNEREKQKVTWQYYLIGDIGLCTLQRLVQTAPLGVEAKCSQIQPASRLSFICVCVFYLNWPHSTDPVLNDIILWHSVSGLVVSILIHIPHCSPESFDCSREVSEKIWVKVMSKNTFYE